VHLQEFVPKIEINCGGHDGFLFIEWKDSFAKP
jgi:hypothetical protein